MRTILWQNVTKIDFKMRQVSYLKTRPFYHKMQRLLQNASVQQNSFQTHSNIQANIYAAKHLTELWNCNGKLFLCTPQKIGENTTSILNCYFSKYIYSLANYKIYNFTSHKQYSFGLIFSGNQKKIHTDNAFVQVFLLCLKRNDSQTVKSSNCQKRFLQWVRYCYNLFQ